MAMVPCIGFNVKPLNIIKKYHTQSYLLLRIKEFRLTDNCQRIFDGASIQVLPYHLLSTIKHTLLSTSNFLIQFTIYCILC